MRLLLVEDDTMIGEALLDLLRGENYAVDWVRDGERADTALRAHRYDLMLLDLGLPRRDGLDVPVAGEGELGLGGLDRQPAAP
jgi:two-component system OmpR family response regulator